MNPKKLAKRLTIKNFLGPGTIYYCDVDEYVTNGHWALRLDKAPKDFQVRMRSMIVEGAPVQKLKALIHDISGREFKNVYPLPGKNDDSDRVIFQPKDKSFKVVFGVGYIGWLRKTFPNLMIMASGETGPAILYLKGFAETEIGLLSPVRY